jgi:uncharacterized protein (DUF2336 family)
MPSPPPPLITAPYAKAGHMSSPLDYETSKRQARDPDPKIRQNLAGHADVRPELLYYLAADPEPAVRAAIAANPTTPRQADKLLAVDRDASVRKELARKIAALLPGLPSGRHDQLASLTLEILATLARDHEASVRASVSEAIKTMPAAPAAIVHQLARDLELPVAAPVLEYSPLLEEEDLLAIIAGNPVAGAVGAIARRQGVTPQLADAIAHSQDEAAIAALLANPSAQIREATLDQLIEVAPAHEPWHEPLVCRPTLPARAVRRLAEFVAERLVQRLQSRPELDKTVIDSLSATLRQRLGASAASAAEPMGLEENVVTKKPEGERPADKARRLAREGKLQEKLILKAVEEADRPFVVAALAVLVAIDVALAEQILRSQNARAIVALVWRAKLSARLAQQIQLKTARIPPSQVLNPRGGDAYPLTEDELAWQLELFGIID